MQTNSTAQEQAQAAISDHEYRRTIEEMDSLAQEGLSHIRAIARLALIALQTPDGHRDTQSLAVAFHAIWCEASATEVNINAAANDVGCAHVDRAHFRRMDAQAAFHDTLRG